MADKQDPQATPSQAGLNPQNMADRGQVLSAPERRRIEAEAKLAEVQAKSAEDAAAAEAAVRAEHRSAVGEELEVARKLALSDAEVQRKAYVDAHARMQPLAVDPATLAIEGALNRATAAALHLDETAPGGDYIVNGRHVDANGNPLE